MSATWNFADVWEAVAHAVPDDIAQVHGARTVTWADTDRHADGLAATLLGAGLQRQDKVALYMYNAPEYMESAFGVFKAALVPVNTNYRYGVDELAYLWDDADVEAVVFHGAFTETVAQLRQRRDRLAWIHVDDGTTPCPEWAVPYAQAAAADPLPTRPARSGDDLLLIYTGGTTGRPKGVMWRQHDMYRVSDTSHDPSDMDLEGVRERIVAAANRPVGLSGAPLMHGTGYVFAGTILSRGGTLVHQQARRFDVVDLLDTLTDRQVTALCIVGEAFARPMVDALDAEPDRWDLSHLTAVSSAGMVWRAESKQRLLRHAPNAILVDLLNSSEASGMGRSVTSNRRDSSTASFRLGANTIVLDDDNRPVEPGSGVVGRLAVHGHLPLGYYKDPGKTEQVFPTVDGVRYSLPGDLATVEADGGVRLLGRGSGVVNIGGEKVFPEEVEDVLRADPDVYDTIVVGVPDDRMGEVVSGVVQLTAGADDLDAVLTRARDRLASYKVPRRMVVVDEVPRSPAGKPDIARVKDMLSESTGKSSARSGEN